MQMENVRVPGYKGTWYEIDRLCNGAHTWILLESEQWGDEANLLVISEDQKVVLETYDDIETTLRDADMWMCKTCTLCRFSDNSIYDEPCRSCKDFSNHT